MRKPHLFVNNVVSCVERNGTDNQTFAGQHGLTRSDSERILRDLACRLQRQHYYHYVIVHIFMIE